MPTKFKAFKDFALPALTQKEIQTSVNKCKTQEDLNRRPRDIPFKKAKGSQCVQLSATEFYDSQHNSECDHAGIYSLHSGLLAVESSVSYFPAITQLICNTQIRVQAKAIPHGWKSRFKGDCTLQSDPFCIFLTV